MTGWDVYWITRLDAVHESLPALVVLGVILFLLPILWSEDIMHVDWKGKICMMAAASTLPIVIVLSVFVPTTKEMAAIYLIPPIVNNEDIQEIPADTAKLLHNKLEEWIDETTKEDK